MNTEGLKDLAIGGVSAAAAIWVTLEALKVAGWVKRRFAPLVAIGMGIVVRSQCPLAGGQGHRRDERGPRRDCYLDLRRRQQDEGERKGWRAMNPFAQNLLWVFRVGDCGGAAAAVATAKRLGAGLIVKFHDGNPADDHKYGFQEQFRACLKLGQQHGVPVLAWGYCYGDKYDSLLKEADAAVMALREGAAGYVIDAETEWEVSQGNDWAKRFLDRVRVQIADAVQRLAYAPFWNMRWHSRYPAAAFSEGCAAVMPQVYYGLAKKRPDQVAAMWEITRTDFEPYGLPIYPIGEFPGATVAHVQAFLDAIGDRPHSWWLLDSAPSELLEAAFPEPAIVPFREYRRVVAELEAAREKLARIREIVM